MLSAEEPKHIDEWVESSGLNSSDVLATLSILERKGIIRQLPGKQFAKVWLSGRGKYRWEDLTHQSETGTPDQRTIARRTYIR